MYTKFTCIWIWMQNFGKSPFEQHRLQNELYATFCRQTEFGCSGFEIHGVTPSGRGHILMGNIKLTLCMIPTNTATQITKLI